MYHLQLLTWIIVSCIRATLKIVSSGLEKIQMYVDSLIPVSSAKE